MKHFIILSTGCYSDYSPNYWMGDFEITQKELDLKALEFGDELMKPYFALPSRADTSGYYWSINDTEKYDIVSGERISKPSVDEWSEKMEAWLKGQGFEKLPEHIPEINIEYSDIPFTRSE